MKSLTQILIYITFFIWGMFTTYICEKNNTPESQREKQVDSIMELNDKALRYECDTDFVPKNFIPIAYYKDKDGKRQWVWKTRPTEKQQKWIRVINEKHTGVISTDEPNNMAKFYSTSGVGNAYMGDSAGVQTVDSGDVWFHIRMDAMPEFNEIK